jgi:hypothetical protein
MKGGPSHEYYVQELAHMFAEQALTVALNVPVRCAGKLIGYGDMVVRDRAGHVLCVEVERSPKRIFSDIAKAKALRAELWIVTPNARLRDAIRRRFARRAVREDKSLSVLTLSQARAEVCGGTSHFSPGRCGEGKNER